MYLTFYGLDEKPFATTVDPKFLYLTPGHREALAHLVYGVQENMGFLVLTGEVGTGKTTLLRALLQRLDGHTAVAFLTNSKLPFEGLLEYMLEDLGVPAPGETHAQRLFALNRFLIARARVGESVVVIFDEAHNLDAETLEHIRLLSNFESATRKLMQILLVGQPELNSKLALSSLRQLTQRIALRAALPPLTFDETRQYIRRRLQVAGARDLGLFTDAAMTSIAKYAKGIPRVVNVVCDHCLILGYADRKRRIDADIVRQAVQYLEDGVRPRRAAGHAARRRWLPRPALAWAALPVVLLALAAVPALTDGGFAGVPATVVESLVTMVRSVRELLP
jgi:general secretion pathway protein A